MTAAAIDLSVGSTLFVRERPRRGAIGLRTEHGTVVRHSREGVTDDAPAQRSPCVGFDGHAQLVRSQPSPIAVDRFTCGITGDRLNVDKGYRVGTPRRRAS
jgi:hypothetical protein